MIESWFGTGWGSLARRPVIRDSKGNIVSGPRAQSTPTTPTPTAVDTGWDAQWREAVAAYEAQRAAQEQAAGELAGQRTHYMDAFRAFFSSVGLTIDSELEGILKGAIDKGYTDADIDIIMPDIQNTQVFKTRFAGYHQRISNGYNAISIAQYLQMEDAYHRVMQQAGLPAGFYDDPSDFGNFIANDVSVEEVSTRVGLAVDAAKKVDPAMRELMTRFYGLGTGDVAAYFLDPSRALPVIEHQYKSAEVASWAQRNGYAVDSMSRFESLVADGVTADQAAQGYGTVRALDDSVGAIAGIYGESYDQSDAERDVFFNDNEKRRRIISKEAATFGGSSSGSTGSAQRSSY